MSLPTPACSGESIPGPSLEEPGEPGQGPSELPTNRPEDAHPTIEFPEPLRYSDDEKHGEIADSDGSTMAVNMNQSIFGLIAAAGSRVDFNDRFDGSSSEEDEAADRPETGRREQHNLSQTSLLQSLQDKRRAHKRAFSGHRLLKSFATLPKRKSRLDRESSRISEPTEEVDEPRLSGEEPSSDAHEPLLFEEEVLRLAPVMSRMLEAKAEIASRPSSDLARPSGEVAQLEEDDESASPLAKRLKDIFEFKKPEAVIEEYPCWLLQSVLLQGFVYITSNHICFYAHLPKKAHAVAKSGFLSKSGKRTSKYSRHWFRLKGDVLSYYPDSTNLYFPNGQIDLRFGISADITDRDKDGVHFALVTSHRTYNFKADSAPSAKEWVKSLQQVIFRSHNDGDSVKISLPINNIIDVEDSQMMEFSDTCKIRVIDNDETYAIDEYFFSFFSFGKEAIQLIKTMVESASAESPTAARELVEHEGKALDAASLGLASDEARSDSSERHQDKIRTARPLDTVLASLPPFSRQSMSLSPRASTEIGPRTSGDDLVGDQERASGATSPPQDLGHGESSSGSARPSSSPRSDQGGEKAPTRAMESSESNLYSSMEEPSFASLSQSAFEDPSASQILRGSEVFHSPTTLRRSPSSSQDISKIDHELEEAIRHPLPRAQTTGQLEISSPSTPSLQSITKMGAYPLQRAGAFADYLNKTGKRMSTLFATESMGYVEKVSGMWKGGQRHYGEPSGLRPDEDEEQEGGRGAAQISMERYRAHFALPDTERLQATYFGYIVRVLPLYGKIYISNRYFCFRSLLPGTSTKLILPLKDIENGQKEKGFRFGYSGLVVVIRGHEELFFEFRTAEIRDDCTVTLLQSLENSRLSQDSDGAEKEGEGGEEGEEESVVTRAAERKQLGRCQVQLLQPASGQLEPPYALADELDASSSTLKPPQPMKITCLTIGSRGDVQPYIALCKRLLEDGHKPKIATHAEFQSWIESHGIEFACVEGDPGELMRLCIENGTFTISFLREANATFRGWLDDLLDSAYRACEGSELLIESPSAMAGIHIAEKLGIPYFRAFTMPWTRTRAYPHAFIIPEHKMGGAYNYMTYVMFDNIFWKATAHQINRWRNKTLGLPNTNLEKMQPNKVPFLYNFSPSVVAPPLDFSDWIRVTGYWFLDEGRDYEPPQDLKDFIKKARDDRKKIVYVGFGSIIVPDPAKMTQEVIDAVIKADVRCILSKGWSDRITSKHEPGAVALDEPEMPPEIHVIKSAPHDWLFRQIDAAAHHGGSGTTGASLRAGVPTIIRPFFGDQFFSASRLEDLGVGVWVKKWGTTSFGRALWEATRNARMIERARLLGEQIRKERGVEVAIQSIYRDMEYAKTLIKVKSGQLEAEEDDDTTEESWTFVRGDEPDPDMVTPKLSEGLEGLHLTTGGVKADLKGKAVLLETSQ